MTKDVGHTKQANAEPSLRAVQGVDLLPLNCRDCGFEPRLSLMRVVCCQVRCLCDGPIPLPEESYRMCVTQCDQIKQQPSTPTVSRNKEVRLTENKKRICVSGKVTMGIVTKAIFMISLYPEFGYTYSFLD